MSERGELRIVDSAVSPVGDAHDQVVSLEGLVASIGGPE